MIFFLEIILLGSCFILYFIRFLQVLSSHAFWLGRLPSKHVVGVSYRMMKGNLMIIKNLWYIEHC